MKKPPIHPSQYSTELMPAIAMLLHQYADVPGGTVLDPFAGLGERFATLVHYLGMNPVGVEIEHGYFDAGATDPCVQQGDATNLPFPDDTFDAIVTSPVYPNGMADNFKANDESVRHTYIHRLRTYLGSDYSLSAQNTAAASPRRSPAALSSFYAIHKKAWAEAYRVLKVGAPIIVNTKDTPSVPFLRDTWNQLMEAGFVIVDHRAIPVGGLNHGKHNKRKLPYEDITVALKHPTESGQAHISFPPR